MPAPIEQLLSRTVYTTDGTTVNWDFSFASGYLDAAHVKAQTKTTEGAITQIVVTPGMLIGEFQLQITPALAAGLELTIYRDTPKNAPLVDFTDESGFSETALDTNAKQAVMVAAEAIDTINASDLTAAIAAAESAGAAASASSASAALAASAVATANAAAVAAQDAADDAVAAAATVNPSSFATAAQGALADSALQPGGAATPSQGALADSSVQASSPTGAALLPAGTTAQRPSTPLYGMQRANNTTGAMEWWNGAIWAPMGGAAAGDNNDITRLLGLLAVPAVIAAAIRVASPAGKVTLMTGGGALAGHVKANGALLSRATYPDLWAYALASGNLVANDGAWAPGGQYSPGDGSTTFRVPDLRSEFPRFADDGRGIDIGRAVGTWQAGTDHVRIEINSNPTLVGVSSVSESNVDAYSATQNRAFTTTSWSGDSSQVPRTYKSRPRNTALMAYIRY